MRIHIFAVQCQTRIILGRIEVGLLVVALERCWLVGAPRLTLLRAVIFAVLVRYLLV